MMDRRISNYSIVDVLLQTVTDTVMIFMVMVDMLCWSRVSAG
jgi:hypothetical protein